MVTGGSVGGGVTFTVNLVDVDGAVDLVEVDGGVDKVDVVGAVVFIFVVVGVVKVDVIAGVVATTIPSESIENININHINIRNFTYEKSSFNFKIQKLKHF